MISQKNNVIRMSNPHYSSAKRYEGSNSDISQVENTTTHMDNDELSWRGVEYYEGSKGNTPDSVEVQIKMDAEKLFDILREDRNESEKRVQQQMQMLEERIAKQSEKSEERILQAVNEIKHDIADAKKETQAAKSWIIGIALATILGIAAMVVTIILAK